MSKTRNERYKPRVKDCQKLRIVFAGTPDFSVPALKALSETGHEVVGVYTQPDRPAGRGRKLQQSAVKQLAVSLGLPCYQPQSLRQADAVSELAALQPDVMVVVAYGLILPPEVLSIPPLGCLNIHGSLLPRWRGAAPIHRAILAGDETTGITIMQMEAGLDTGPMLATRVVPVTIETNTQHLHDQLAALGAESLVGILQPWCRAEIQPVVQDEALATYAHKLEKREADIDWSQDAVQIHRLIRAFNPWPVAQSEWDGNKLRIWEAQLSEEPTPDNCVPGQVLCCDQSALRVVTGAGSLLLKRVQLAGRKPVGHAEFANGRNLKDVVLGAPKQI